ncbi:MAG: sigma-54-dependent Fis family transcriptional regulator [Colwellia sp.]|nr:sigma-54-dependent Fis family transcriptional regulator [Colwellia sp.]
MDKILIVDDNPSVCQALELLLELHDLPSISCNSPKEAITAVMHQRISLVILDMNFSQDTTSGEEGKDTFYQLRQINPDLPIILITAWTHLSMAIELVKNGAADYLNKPWDDEKLLVTIKNLVEISELSQANEFLLRQHNERSANLKSHQLCGIVFASSSMQRLIDMTLQVAKSDASILITGPNGTGKEKIAEITQANSSRNNQPFIKVNVGALPHDLMEAELFGAEPGAYTGITKTRIGRFEAADNGTLFLDEIGNLPLAGQVKLLRVLQTGEFERLGSHVTKKVNVRVISATNSNLLEDINTGKFREDLYYRLNVIQLDIPALKYRVDDIIPLTKYFLKTKVNLPLEVEQALTSHPWPGNVRELENACQRAVLLSQSTELSAADFGLASVKLTPEKLTNERSNELTKNDITQAINIADGNISHAAKTLNLSRQALYRRMDKFGIAK